MSSRSVALIAPSTRCAETPPSSWVTRLVRMARWSSSSEGEGAFTLCFLKHGLGARRLVHKHFERRHVGIPFDERRHRAETRERFCVERPDLRRDARAVIVDAEHPSAVEPPLGVPRNMDLAHG